MSDKALTIRLPEELIEQAAAAQLDMRALLEEAIRSELARQQPGFTAQEAQLQDLRPANRLADALRTLRAGKRILGLSRGEIVASDDFDDSLHLNMWNNPLH